MNNQSPITKPQRITNLHERFAVLLQLELGASLVLGVWNLEL